MITPQPGYIVDPQNPNGVIKDPGTSTMPGATPTTVTAPPATPTAVVSGSTATDHVNGTIIPALKTAQTDLVNHQIAQKVGPGSPGYKPEEDPNAHPIGIQPGSSVSNQGKPGYDVWGNPIVTGPTPEQQIADTPDAGNAWYYDAQGNRVQAPIGAVPAGYSTTNPTQAPTTPVVNSASLSSGTTFKQFSDGTYGQYDATGKYVGKATVDQYNTAKDAQDITASFKQALNGAYPLKPWQQAQIENVKAMYQKFIDEQAVANANFTGGTTVAQNLYGMGNSIVGLGAIKSSVDAGLAKIADIQGKMASAVTTMQSAFESENLDLLKSAYTMYSKSADDLQKNIDKIHDDAVAAAKSIQEEKDKQAQLIATQQNATDNDIRSIIAEAGKGGATPAQVKAMNDALAKHDYAGAVQAAAGSLQDPTSPAGQYSAYVKTQTAAGKSPMTAGDFIAAQKYKDAYAAASASAAAQGAYSDSDKNQNKLEHQLQAAALNSRSNLGIQSKKVSAAIAAQVLLNQYKDKDGKYNVPSSAYGELLLSVANMLSPTGVASVTTQEGLRQATLKGDFNNMVTYATGRPIAGTTHDVIDNLATTIKNEGVNSEIARNQELTAQTPTDLHPDRASHVVDNLPSYQDMSNGSIAYQSPEQINATAVSALAEVQKENPQMLAEIHKQFPNLSPVEIAQKLGKMPTK